MQVGAPQAVVVSILSVEDDLQRFSRRLAAEVNQGPLHLARVVATGTQVYPVRLDTLRDSATLLRCEFRMRHAATPISIEVARGLLERIRSHQVLEAQLIDDHGMVIGPVEEFSVAS